MRKKTTIFFISRDAAWQNYRNEVLTCLAKKFNCKIVILTTGKLKRYLRDSEYVQYRIFPSWFPIKWKPSFFPSAVIYALKQKPAAVLCLDNTTQLTEYFAFVMCKIFMIRFVWWTHANNPTRVYRSRLARTIRQKYAVSFLKRGDAVITFSESGRRYLLEKAIDKSKVVCAPNTLDTDKLLKLADEVSSQFTRSQLCAELGLPQNGRFILFMGRLLRAKRADHAIRAMPIIMKALPDIHLIIIGDGDEKDHLEELANSLVPDRILFVGAIFDDELKAKLFELSELFVMPGYVGLAIVHAFCYGLPLLTSRINSHAPEIQYLHDDKNGYFVEDGNIEELAEKIIGLVTNDEKLQAFSEAAVETIKREADINFMIEQMAIALKISEPKTGLLETRK